MPLPTALAARLQKRGLLNANNTKGTEKKKKDYKGVSGCPNKSNVYHDCTHWCGVHWKGVTTPDPKYLRNVAKLTQKYPLPQNWMEVFDKGLGRYYYWDLETDLVSWLPPKHPKAKPTESAAKLRERLHTGGRLNEERIIFKNDNEKEQERKREKREKDRSDRKDRERDRERDRDKERDRDRDRDKDKERDRDRDKDRDRERDRERERDRDRETDKERKDKHEEKERRKKRKEDNLDPMDPAAYSDCPIGTWSDGLETNKSGADSTASGALYQQRPYPAPGEVLASNKAKKKKD